MSSIIPYRSPETAMAVRKSVVNALLDSALSRLAAPPRLSCVGVGSEYDELNCQVLDHLFGPLPELPAWSPETKALVTEHSARTGGTR
ncbi:hypothetical protein [Kitasatospora sp. NPDC058478]|uniref:hypothetical protein n=1 Tax=unclassified Kitasatospora TaxID=2633591 RepID=UPI0036562137